MITFSNQAVPCKRLQIKYPKNYKVLQTFITTALDPPSLATEIAVYIKLSRRRSSALKDKMFKNFVYSWNLIQTCSYFYNETTKGFIQ